MSKINIFKIVLIVVVIGVIGWFAYESTETLPPPPHVEIHQPSDAEIQVMWEKHQDSIAKLDTNHR